MIAFREKEMATLDRITIELSDLFVKRTRDLFRQQGLTDEEVEALFEAIGTCQVHYRDEDEKVVVEIPGDQIPEHLRERLDFLEDGLQL